MSVFFVNTCKFNGCGITFGTLQELIYHIEDTHLDFEPKNADENEFKQTSCLPVSCVFRLFSGDYQSPIKPTTLNGNLSVTLNSSRKDSGSELDEENYESESEKSSIDSWSNNSIESDSNPILKIINPPKPVQINNKADDSEKPYICQADDNCKKRYRNSNGLKYHMKSCHTENGMKKEQVTRMYKCACNKNYKTIYGLKNHARQCSNALASPLGTIGKLSELKTTLVHTNGQATSKPIMSVTSVSIANVSPNKTSQTELSNQQPKLEDGQSNEMIKSLQQPHLSNSIEAKQNHTLTSQA